MGWVRVKIRAGRGFQLRASSRDWPLTCLLCLWKTLHLCVCACVCLHARGEGGWTSIGIAIGTQHMTGPRRFASPLLLLL